MTIKEIQDMANATVGAFEKVIVFVAEITIPSGMKKITKIDLENVGVDTRNLPPSTLASLGQKKVIDTRLLAPFQALKKRVERLLLASGTRCIGGTAIAVELANSVATELSLIAEQFQLAKLEFASGYVVGLDQFVEGAPANWKAAIKAAAPSVNGVLDCITFKFSAVSIGQPLDIQGALTDETLSADLYASLCREVRAASKEIVVDLSGRQEITRRALRPINAVIEKLQSLSFLGSDIIEAIGNITETLDSLPKHGPLVGTDLDRVLGSVSRHLTRLGLPVVAVPVETEEEMEGVEEEKEVQVVMPSVIPVSSAPVSIKAQDWDF